MRMTKDDSKEGNVREALDSDAPDLCGLLSDLRGYAVPVTGIVDQLQAIVRDDNRTVLVVEDDEIVGMAVVNLLFKLPKVEARIDEVVVSEQARGKGYGKLLMKGCEIWAWDHGADTIELTSRPSREAANTIYQKLGYHIRETNVYNKER